MGRGTRRTQVQHGNAAGNGRFGTSTDAKLVGSLDMRGQYVNSLRCFIYCTKWMTTQTEDNVKSVYKHWTSRNQVDVSYDDVKQKVRDRGMMINRMVEEMDWECFAPLTMDESFARDAPASMASQDSSDDK